MRRKVIDMEKKVIAQGPLDVSVGPVAWAVFAANGNIRIWSSASEPVRKLAEAEGMNLVPLYTIPEGWRNEIEELFGEYWDCAYQEGHMNRPDGDKANEILHRLRKLLPPNV